VPYVASESEARDGGARQSVHVHCKHYQTVLSLKVAWKYWEVQQIYSWRDSELQTEGALMHCTAITDTWVTLVILMMFLNLNIYELYFAKMASHYNIQGTKYEYCHMSASW